MHSPRTVLLFLFLATIALSHNAARADLKPEEIALIVARGNRESLSLAEYYCRQRGVPKQNICQVDVPSGEVLEHKHWRWAVRPEIHRWIEKNDPEKKLRCLVTVWGVPLKIKRAPQDDASQAYLAHLEGERDVRLSQLIQVADNLDKLAADANGPPAQPDIDPPADLAAAKTRLESALRAAQTRLAKLSPAERQDDAARLQQLASAAGGARVLLQGVQQQLNRLAAAEQTPSEQLQQQFNLLRGRASAFTGIQLLLDRRAPSYERDQIALTAIQQTGGLIAAIEWLQQQAGIARKNETGAALDSELSLVMWPEDYQLLRWQPNYLHHSFAATRLPKTFRTLMVARLDGPTLKIAKGLIDTAMKVEQEGGLKGNVYLDARGLAKPTDPPQKPGSYKDYDRALLTTAEGLKQLKDKEDNPRFNVTLNTEPQLFQPGDCPDTALYCGWYSLANYVDAFDFAPGAIAYHLASSEARTLREENAKVWCKSLLEDGVVATIGPVYEPYLLAFPRPNEFFGELVKGDQTLVEVYYRTKSFNSWMMTLVGDPLYRPFGSRETVE